MLLWHVLNQECPPPAAAAKSSLIQVEATSGEELHAGVRSVPHYYLQRPLEDALASPWSFIEFSFMIFCSSFFQTEERVGDL